MEGYPRGGPDSGWSDANLRPTAYGIAVWREGKGNAYEINYIRVWKMR